MSDFNKLLADYCTQCSNPELKYAEIVKVDSTKTRDGWSVKIEYFPDWDGVRKYTDDISFNVDFEDVLSWMYFK